ncbi:hypothetical protein J7E93_33865 [Streptomyces sp. ISL-36]|uniref:hypothetical protein n=1 Tax=Streptomyces sp. ISL-36 TaxID=2819182 RepID=UPI001BE6EDBD|nr:hypothetical protein [Streptomyces sp. ISL-36]MBT2444995.1 hypothetical protein [Streptomyces sp. ISL-36]
MSVTDATVRAEYGAAVERMAGRALDALRDGGGTGALSWPLSRAELAAVRVLGADLFAPHLVGASVPGDDAALAVAEAYQLFPPQPECDLVTAWHDWAARALSAHIGSAEAGQAATVPPEPPPPARTPDADAGGWRQRASAVARLAPLALPGFDSPLHQAVRAHPLALARGAVRAMLRRDHRTAARLTRWLAWLHYTHMSVPLEIAPLLARLRQVGDGSARTRLDLAVAERLLHAHPEDR